VTPDMTVELDLPVRADSVARARRSLERLRGTVSASLFEDLRLLLSEVVTNSLRHAGLTSSDRVDVVVSAGPGHVRVEVFDRGPGFDAPEEGPPAGAASGWGLVLVEHLADRWGVDRVGGRTRVWFELDR
jgi:anti-sigma regulatory factor (Ser/Thr protein kinase)